MLCTVNTIVKCPTCSKEVEWITTSTYRPFCCKRCRLIDLGDWASEKHAIADEPLIPNEVSSFNSDDEF